MPQQGLGFSVPVLCVIAPPHPHPPTPPARTPSQRAWTVWTGAWLYSPNVGEVNSALIQTYPPARIHAWWKPSRQARGREVREHGYMVFTFGKSKVGEVQSETH